MTCPTCKGPSTLRISVTFEGTVDIYTAGEDSEVTDSETGNSKWADDSGVTCLDCEWEGAAVDLDEATTH
jgi:hypothetical protein